MSYYSVVSSSSPAIWWRMHDPTASVTASDSGYLGVPGGCTGTKNTYWSWASGAAVYSNGAYFPAAEMSSSYYADGWNTLTKVSSVVTSTTAFLNPFASTASAFTVEWLYRYEYNWQYTPASSTMVSWIGTNNHGWRFGDTNGGEGGRYRCDMIWLSGATTQACNVNWGATTAQGSLINNTINRYGMEGRSNYWTPMGLGGIHNGWHHFVFRFYWVGSAPYFELIVDGERLEYDTAGGTFYPPVPPTSTITSASHAIHIGNIATNGTWGFWSEVAFYDRVLPDDEVYTHWAEIAKNLSNALGAYQINSGSNYVALATTQRVAHNISDVGASTGSAVDARASKTNPGVN